MKSTESETDARVVEHLAVFQRGAVELIEERQLAKLIAKSFAEDRPLRVKFGMDPSSPDLHVGHAIPLMKLRDIQELGHRIVLIVGDSTAMVGDPSGRNKLRPQLTREEVERNLVTYTDQAARILDMERTEVRRNSEWFDAMQFHDVLKLASRTTVAQMIERDTFQKRMEKKEPIGVHEFFYPLMQGWDSVQIRCDAELGGTDQLFNLLVGRELQRQEDQLPQVCFTTPLIDGLDGRKMSKAYGNTIALTASANEMFFGVMRLDDAVMETWFTHLTRIPVEETVALLAGHPRAAKARLAEELTTYFHDAEAARGARDAFDRQVRDKELPEDIPEMGWPGAEDVELPLANLLRDIGLAKSTSEARRTIDQGGVRLDGEVVRDPMHPVNRPVEPLLIQVGKKRFARVV